MCLVQNVTLNNQVFNIRYILYIYRKICNKNNLQDGKNNRRIIEMFNIYVIDRYLYLKIATTISKNYITYLFQ